MTQKFDVSVLSPLDLVICPSILLRVVNPLNHLEFEICHLDFQKVHFKFRNSTASFQRVFDGFF